MMSQLNSSQRQLGKIEYIILIIFFVLLFFCYEYILLSRLLASNYLGRGLNRLKKASSAQGLVKESLLYQGALKSLKESIQFNPYDSRPYFEYANIIEEISDNDVIRNSLDKNIIGAKSFEKLEFYDLARSYYQKAISREPLNAIYHQRLGGLYDKLLDSQKAEEELKKAILLDPNNITIHLCLSQYYLAKNKEADFKYHLYKAVELHKVGLRGGPLSTMVENFLKDINRLDLIK